MTNPTPTGPHKPAVQKIMDLARRFRCTPGDLYDDAYKAVESAVYDALLAATPAPDGDAKDSARLDWLIGKNMLFAWVENDEDGDYTSLRAIGTVNVTGIVTKDPRAAIDAAMSGGGK